MKIKKRIEKDANNNIISEFHYDRNGNIIYENFDGDRVWSEYDAQNRLVKCYGDIIGTTSIEYFKNLKITNKNGVRQYLSSNIIDDKCVEIYADDYGHFYKEIKFIDDGSIISKIDNNGNFMNCEYDENRNIIQCIHNKRIINYEYDENGYIISVKTVDEDGNTLNNNTYNRQNIYDENRNLIKTITTFIDDDVSIIETFNKYNNIISTEYSDNTFNDNYEYDENNNKIRYKDSNGDNHIYKYNSNNELTYSKDYNGETYYEYEYYEGEE